MDRAAREDRQANKGDLVDRPILAVLEVVRVARVDRARLRAAPVELRAVRQAPAVRVAPAVARRRQLPLFPPFAAWLQH